ncbi:MAG: hypothetical protein Kow00128_02510 [Deltaproteobacteria bacterium]
MNGRDFLRKYLEEKIDQLLVTMGSRPLDSSRLSDGELVELDPIGTVSDSFTQVLSHLQDMNAKLRRQEELFRTLAEFSTDWVFWRRGDRMLYISPACEPISGYSQEELLREPGLFYSIVHPEDRRSWEEHCRVVEEGRIPSQAEFRIVTKTGELRWISHVCRPVYGEGGAFLGVRGTNTNITERKRSEEALRESEERLRDFFDNAIDLIQSVSPEGRFLYVNRSWKETLGYGEDEALRLSIFDIIAPDHRERCRELFARLLRGEDIGQFETVFLAKDGRRILVEGHANCRFEEGKAVSSRSIFRDITEKRKIEEEFRKTSTLESIGILAGGIAHDFNNILMAILGNLSLLKKDLAPGSPLRDRVAEAENASLRAKDLTAQLLTFSRGGAPIREAASVPELIREAAGFASRGSGVRCKFDIPERVWPIEVDPGQIAQVIGNMVINACQAMPGGGVVRIGAENIRVDGESGLRLREGRYVRIRIEDHGVGIPKEHLDKIFTPFFTTKPEGTGLGLATCHSIVRRHEGAIRVESEIGKGSIFSVYLPATADPVPPRPREAVPPADGHGRVLVMDDEEMVRTVAVEILHSLGYETEAVEDGECAVAAYREAMERGDPFDAVLMDLTVPGGMGGKEAIRKIRDLDPKVRAIVSSGYSNDPVMASFREYGFAGRIAKPYRIADLGRVLREVLAGAAEPAGGAG